MASNAKIEQEFYLAFKDIFKGDYALFRKSKSVQKRIQESKHFSEVKQIHQKYSQGHILKTVKTLLEAKVFESQQIAKMRFQDQDSSPSLVTQEPETPEAKSPESESTKPAPQEPIASDSTGTTFTNANGLSICHNPVKMNSPTVKPEEPKEAHEIIPNTKLATAFSIASSPKDETARQCRIEWNDFLERYSQTARSAPSSPTISEQSDFEDAFDMPAPKWMPGMPELTNMRAVEVSPSIRPTNIHSRNTHFGNIRPTDTLPTNTLPTNIPAANPLKLQVVLPLPTQLRILSRIQTILEHACFQFAQENMPDILEQAQWDCPEAGELNVWIHHLRSRSQHLYYLACSRVEGFSLPAIFQSMPQIRHLAVHRQRIDVAYLSLLMSHAVTFAAILGVPDALEKVIKIQACAQHEILKLSDIKNTLDKDLNNSLQNIVARRAELDALEQNTIVKAHKELEQHRLEACKRLDKVLLDTEMTNLSLGENEPVVKAAEQPSLWHRVRTSLPLV